MNKPIIPIEEASPELKELFVKMGILERIGDDYRCKEK